MLATDYRTLPDPVQERVRAFFAANHAWLGAVVADGQASARIAFVGSPEDAARLMLSALEGAMLVAHALGDPEHFRAASEALLRGWQRAVRPAGRRRVSRPVFRTAGGKRLPSGVRGRMKA